MLPSCWISNHDSQSPMNSRFLLLSAGALFAASSVQAQLLSENFSYSAGNLTTVSSAAWVAHSGAGSNPVQVNASGAVVLAGGSGTREDVNRALGSTYVDGVLTASFTVDLSLGSVPTTGTGTYFFHFKDGTATGFRGRVYLGSPSVADTDLFRLGLENDASDGGASISYTSDLDRTEVHTVTISYDIAARTSKLWVDVPTSGAATLQDSTPAGSFLEVTSVGFRQASHTYSGLAVDNLVVSYTPVPEPEEWAAIAGAGLIGFALWRRRR